MAVADTPRVPEMEQVESSPTSSSETAEATQTENSQLENDSSESTTSTSQELHPFSTSTPQLDPGQRSVRGNRHAEYHTLWDYIGAFVKGTCYLVSRAFWSLFQNSLSTTQLYALSIVLLSAHMTVQKVVESVPYALWRIFLWVGGDKLNRGGNEICLDSLLSIREEMGGGFAGDVKILEQILDFVLLSGSNRRFESSPVLSQENTWTELSTNTFHSTDVDDGSVSTQALKFLEAPILSIMLPTTIMSIFLLITMSIFLLVHILFQIFLYVSGSLSQSSPFSSGTFYLWGMICILMLEAVVPWLCFGIGVYVSVVVGGTVWCIFLIGTILLWCGLRALRNGVYRRIQDANSTTSL